MRAYRGSNRRVIATRMGSASTRIVRSGWVVGPGFDRDVTE